MSNELSNVAVALPSGEGFGWGHCGKELTKRLVAKGAVTVTNSKPYIESCNPKTVLQAISGRDFGYTANLMGFNQVGYGFIEDDIIGRKNLPLARRLWDGVISGSTWMNEWVREDPYMIDSGVVIQGVDTDIFHYREPKGLDTPFTIGSFGKLEFRKGQDIVIKAFGLFQEKYPEVKLVTAWSSPWPQLIKQMAAEPGLLCKMDVFSDYTAGMIREVLTQNLPEGSWMMYGGSSENMAAVMALCDVALFPSRCEAGQGLMMAEAGAIGVPCITANATGHKDFTGRIDYPCKDLNLNCGKTFVYKQGDIEVGNWHSVCLDEILSQLEYAYQQREALRARRKEISEWFSQWTWDRSADKMQAILGGY